MRNYLAQAPASNSLIGLTSRKASRNIALAVIAISCSISLPASADVAPNTIRNITMTFDENPSMAMRQIYETALTEVRVAAGHPYRQGVFTTQFENRDNHGLIRLNLVRRSDNRYVILWIRPYDLYLLGYTANNRAAESQGRNGNQTVSFSGSNLNAALLRAGQQWALDTAYSIAPTGSYQSLSQPLVGYYPPSVQRNQQLISYGGFRAAWSNLDASVQPAVSPGAGGVNVRPALQFMIGLFSESARLHDVRGQFREAFASYAYNHSLGNIQIGLENDWGHISDYARDITNGTYRTPLFALSGVYSNFSDVAAKVAIIKGFN